MAAGIHLRNEVSIVYNKKRQRLLAIICLVVLVAIVITTILGAFIGM